MCVCKNLDSSVLFYFVSFRVIRTVVNIGFGREREERKYIFKNRNCFIYYSSWSTLYTEENKHLNCRNYACTSCQTYLHPRALSFEEIVPRSHSSLLSHTININPCPYSTSLLRLLLALEENLIRNLNFSELCIFHFCEILLYIVRIP